MPSAIISVIAWITGNVWVGIGNPETTSSSANSTADATELPTTPSRSSIPEKRQYCCGMRNGSPATSSVIAPPPMNHSGCSSPPSGSAR